MRTFETRVSKRPSKSIAVLVPPGSDGLHPGTFEPTPKWAWQFHSMGFKDNSHPIANSYRRVRRSRGEKRRQRALKMA